ncbi:MAG: transketolase-like TK C-terminal-containing protein, partial [Rickettsiales bacterium]
AGARKNLGWNSPPFEIPETVLAGWREAGSRSAGAFEDWNKRLDGMDAKKAAEFNRRMAGELPEGWQTGLNGLKKTLSENKPKEATRVSSQNVLEVLNPLVPEMLGGSADLTGSNNTKTAGLEPVQAPDYKGRYVYYGVREHGMASAMNGMALHGGLLPYGGTFLVFTDYCRPAIRLSAIMQQRVVYVMTHDSIGLGEDGPTHQPVEHLAALRAMPNLQVFRPADAVETAECWALSIASSHTPSVLALTRQGIPTLRTTHTEDNLCAYGAYTLCEFSDDNPQAVLIGTGSEVHLCVEAAAELRKSGIRTRVVSMPCWELFAQQPESYREEVLGKDTLKVAVEAAGDFGWERHIGRDGIFIGMEGFGESAPAPQLYAYFGITSANIVKKVQTALG